LLFDSKGNPLNAQTVRRIEKVIGRRVIKSSALAGGKISEVVKLDLDSGESIVAKVGAGSHDLTIEAYMLRYLRANSALPVPEVYHEEANLLLLQYIEGRNSWDEASLAQLGSMLGQLHQISARQYGLERDTLIGPLHQPNPPSTSWITFFCDQRLRYIIELASRSGTLSAELETRLLRFAETVPRFLIEPQQPSLIHGDMWRTNVIARDRQVVGILDPAIYFAHSEMELAYMTLFDDLPEDFYAAYCDISAIDPEFFSLRRHIYNLYPLLIHLIIFGERYFPPIDACLKRFGH
jgi:fructosamine-3-kinase